MSSFRAVPERDRRRYREILQYAFAPQKGPALDETDSEWPPTLFDQRGLYVNGRLVSTCKLYTLEAEVRGVSQRIGGLGAVATAPEDRNNGYSRTLCRDAVREYRQSGVGLVALWPFSTSFYRNLGWGVANYVTRYELSPKRLPEYDVPGRMRRFDGDDWERLRQVETNVGNGIGLFFRRSEQWWRERTLANWSGNGDPYCYGYERDGRLEGYLIYTVDDGEDRTLTVRNMAYTDENAKRGLFDFLRGHGSQIQNIVIQRAVDADLLDRVSRPKHVDREVTPGPMVRLSSLSTLERLTWPETTVQWTMDVSDPLLDASDGQFTVSIADGEATVEEDVDSEPDLSVGISTLSQLAIGATTVERASRLGTLAISTESMQDQLEAVFTREPISLQEFF